MKKLMSQIIKFGFVGGLCFLIDFIISIILVDMLIHMVSKGTATLIGGFFGFLISLIINYLLSMKFVFVRKAELDRKKEFVIFCVLSIIGLGINELILWVCSVIYDNYQALRDTVVWVYSAMHSVEAQIEGAAWETASYTLWFAAGKVIATAIVMVYNFITRKIFLEQKTDGAC